MSKIGCWVNIMGFWNSNKIEILWTLKTAMSPGPVSLQLVCLVHHPFVSHSQSIDKNGIWFTKWLIDPPYITIWAHKEPGPSSSHFLPRTVYKIIYRQTYLYISVAFVTPPFPLLCSISSTRTKVKVGYVSSCPTILTHG